MDKQRVKKTTCAIVVTYNRCNLLKECVDALIANSDKLDIMVVDNCSTDNTKQEMSKYIENNSIQYFNTGVNLGGAGGFEYGMRLAYEKGYDYLWIMDDDTIVKSDSLDKLLEFSKRKDDEFGFLSSMALWTDGNPCNMNYHIIDPLWSQNKLDLCEGNIRITEATFVSCFVRRKVIEDVGLPIGKYFIWGDDTEYTLRISRKYPCYLISNSIVIHKMQTNAATLKLEEVRDIARIDRMYYSLRNNVCTSKRLGIKKFVRCSIDIMLLFKRVLFSSGMYKNRKLAIIIRGYLSGIVFHPEIPVVEGKSR